MLPESVQAFIDAEIAGCTTDYSDLRAVFLNGTLKRSPETSHTDALVAISSNILRGVGVRVDEVRTVDHVIPPGVYPDMREHGWPVDDFPAIYRELIEPAHIVVLATPIWLGDQSSMTRLVIERLYGWSGDVNAASQWAYYGKTGGVLVTGNEDGGKHCSAQMLYALQHIGFSIPPPGRCLLGRWSRTRPVLPRRQPGRQQPLDDAQHRVRDLEHAPLRAPTRRRGRDSRVRQPHLELGSQRLRAPQPEVPRMTKHEDPTTARTRAPPGRSPRSSRSAALPASYRSFCSRSS